MFDFIYILYYNIVYMGFKKAYLIAILNPYFLILLEAFS